MRSPYRAVSYTHLDVYKRQVYNPEPLAPFFDCMMIGEGEEQIVEFCQRHRELRDAGVPRAEMLRELSKIGGCLLYTSASSGQGE